MAGSSPRGAYFWYRVFLHSQSDIQGCYTGRSVLTRKVNEDMPTNFNSSNHLIQFRSGQLRNLG